METISKKMFGTDGVRDIANRGAMTPEMVMRLGRAFVMFLKERGYPHPRIAVGRDTRRSGTMIESALVAGIMSAGGHIYTLGVFPTPGVSYLVSHLGLSAGAVISASHNPAEYNGIKFLDSNGFKLTDEEEATIEAYFDDDQLEMWRPTGAAVGDAFDASPYKSAYVEWLKGHMSTIGVCYWPIVVDASNGAAYDIVKDVFSLWGGPVTYVGATPDGLNINESVGVMHMGRLSEKVWENYAYLGVAYDGDTDRVLFCDNKGRLLDGDIMLWILGRYLNTKNELGSGVVATVMSNMILEEKLNEDGIKVFRCPVGDRYVLEKMQECGSKLGGEQSGHVIASDYVTTGDGLLTGILFLRACIALSEDISTLVDRFPRYPQILKNLKLENRDSILASDEIKQAQEAAVKKLAGNGRILLRSSGTEPLLRILVEAKDEKLMQEVCDDLESAIMKISGDLG